MCSLQTPIFIVSKAINKNFVAKAALIHNGGGAFLYKYFVTHVVSKGRHKETRDGAKKITHYYSSGE